MVEWLVNANPPRDLSLRRPDWMEYVNSAAKSLFFFWKKIIGVRLSKKDS
jgi:hypothetical protein